MIEEYINRINFAMDKVKPIEEIVKTLIGNKKFITSFDTIYQKYKNVNEKSFKEYLMELLNTSNIDEIKEIKETLKTNNITTQIFIERLVDELTKYCNEQDRSIQTNLAKNGVDNFKNYIGGNKHWLKG